MTGANPGRVARFVPTRGGTVLSGLLPCQGQVGRGDSDPRPGKGRLGALGAVGGGAGRPR